MSHHQPAKKLVALQLDPNLLAIIDALAGRQYTSRSEFIRRAVLRELETQGVCPLRPTVAA